MCVKNPATFLQFGGSVSIWWEPMDKNRVLGAVLEPGEAGRATQGVLVRDTFHYPGPTWH